MVNFAVRIEWIISENYASLKCKRPGALDSFPMMIRCVLYALFASRIEKSTAAEFVCVLVIVVKMSMGSLLLMLSSERRFQGSQGHYRDLTAKHNVL